MYSTLALAAALWPTAVTEYCPPQKNTIIIGVASTAKGLHAYCEYFSSLGDGRTTVEYFRHGKLFATKELDYTKSPLRPSVKQVDLRNGERREVNIGQGNIELLYQRSGEEKVTKVNLLEHDVDIVDAGFDHFVKDNWQELISGKSLSVSFGSMIHQKPLPLRVSSLSSEKCPHSGTPIATQYCFSVDVNNAFLRMLLDNLKISYDRDRRLLQFDGVVNVLDDTGKSQSATINYFYKTDYLK